MENIQVVTKIKVNQMMDVVFELDEIIAAINTQPIEIRMNMIANMLNGINSSNFEGLQPGHQKIIIEYLKKKLNEFTKYSPQNV